MSHILNPEYRPHRELGETNASWDLLKNTVRAFLQANADSTKVTEFALRAVDPKLRDDRVWRQLASDMQLIALPEAP